MSAERRRVVVVGMLNSVHLGRWLSCFVEEPLDVLLFPSRHYKKVHPIVNQLLTSTDIKARFHLACAFPSHRTSSYLEYAKDRLHGTLGQGDAPWRVKWLARAIGEFDPEIVHALELQHAGYLVASLPQQVRSPLRVVMSNWGSDIVAFAGDPIHHEKLTRLFERADSYGAECARDYALARALGFRGTDLPMVPNSGWLPDWLISQGTDVAASHRAAITIKGYWDWAGRADLSLRAVLQVLSQHPEAYCNVLAANGQLKEILKQAPDLDRERVKFFTPGELSHEGVCRILLESRAYLGMASSDGASTTFLEALAAGAYPIQTKTSCAQQWSGLGVGAHIDCDLQSAVAALDEAMSNDNRVDASQVMAVERAEQRLSRRAIEPLMRSYYLGD